VLNIEIDECGKLNEIDENNETDENPKKTSALLLRRRVSQNQEVAANKMIKKHDHKRNKVTREYEVSENVTLVKTKIDRGSSDLPRLPCKICDVRGTSNRMYELACSYGKISYK
jgi:hypothetical protein